MANTDLQIIIEEATQEFVLKIIEYIKCSSLEELMALRINIESPPRRRPGRPSIARVISVIKRRPGRPSKQTAAIETRTDKNMTAKEEETQAVPPLRGRPKRPPKKPGLLPFPPE